MRGEGEAYRSLPAARANERLGQGEGRETTTPLRGCRLQWRWIQCGAQRWEKKEKKKKKGRGEEGREQVGGAAVTRALSGCHDFRSDRVDSFWHRAPRGESLRVRTRQRRHGHGSQGKPGVKERRVVASGMGRRW